MAKEANESYYSQSSLRINPFFCIVLNNFSIFNNMTVIGFVCFLGFREIKMKETILSYVLWLIVF